MHNLIIAVLCSVAVSVLLKVARKRNIVIQQAIAFNYIVALSLSWFLLKPDFKGLEFSEFIVQSENTPIFLALGILLPSVFIIMSKAVEFAGIVRSDAAQRLSLFLPILAAFSLAACIMFIYLLFKRTQWNVANFIGGIILGGLNFFNILFYIKAHQSFGANPTLVFAGMNIGVICLGTITGALIFKEKISKVNWLGIVFSLCAIFCLYYLDKILA